MSIEISHELYNLKIKMLKKLVIMKQCLLVIPKIGNNQGVLELLSI